MAFNAFMPGEDNWMRGQPMPGQAPQMGTPAAPAMTGQPQKPRPIMNAFSKIFEIGAPEAFEAGRQKKLTQNLGNALAGGDYGGAAEMALRGGQLEQGLKLRGEAETRQKAQMDEQRKAEAQAVYRVFSSAPDMNQLNNLAMTDPVGFERMAGISADEYLQVGGQLAQMGMNPEQIRQFIVQGAQAELGMAPAGPVEGKVVNNRLVNPITGELMGDFSDAPQAEYTYETVGNNIVAIDKRDPNNRIVVGPAPARAPLVSLSMDGKQESAFATEAGKLEAQNFGTLVEMGQAARRNRVTLDQLDIQAANIPGGLEAVVKNELGNYGIETKGLTEIQATEALINQLVPAQRPPGSGPMSDRDLALFKASLPRLIQTAEGREKIIANIKAVNNYVLMEGEIASRVISGQITPEQGRAEMQALGNPLAGQVQSKRLKYNADTGEFE